ncbi:MAG: arsenic efflux protein, partial [Oscillospiraceae bacterium]|nr:arsenic efflux protein [Oscillospiraceae bacterium]
MFEEFLDEVVADALLDLVKLLPFLFVTYLILELIEHKSKRQTAEFVRKAGAWGPLIGSAVGIVPQCGFSASASNLYAMKLISAGTLISVYLSTSDEMIPIFISESAPITLLLKVLACKFLFGVLFGFIIDKLFRGLFREKADVRIHDMCVDEHCECEKHGVVISAVIHTLKIAAFILIATLALNAAIFFIGEDVLKTLVISKPVIGSLITGLVGLIPNCAASVIITELYLGGALT